ncbi:MarR family winged helix-turn-helix transcriptional regulator [Ideonella dechloratans]|uniref:MarR family winged helix-turn-helix transcriptional regulator n=1 Tax=Ideonella dechloratans TaxID=36863 RepID=UPI0035AF3CC8
MPKMPKPSTPDAVDLILAQWREQRPDLDTRSMGPLGRLGRCYQHLVQRMEATFAQFGLSRWEFDVLATLRRAGPPHCLAPTALFQSMMISSGTLTHRLKGLEARGWISRQAHPDDARSLLVQLSPAGLALIDRAVEAHVQTQREVLSVLPQAQLAALDAALARLLTSLETAPDAGSAPEA